MENQEDSPWVVYLLQSDKDGSYYVGISTNVVARLKKHNEGKGAKRTRGRGPWSLRYAQPMPSKSEALKTECAWKKKTRTQKSDLYRKV